MRPIGTTGNWSYRCRQFYGDRFLLVGDAAGFIDPLFSTGVLMAPTADDSRPRPSTLRSVLATSRRLASPRTSSTPCGSRSFQAPGPRVLRREPAQVARSLGSSPDDLQRHHVDARRGCLPSGAVAERRAGRLFTGRPRKWHAIPSRAPQPREQIRLVTPRATYKIAEHPPPTYLQPVPRPTLMRRRKHGPLQ